jgi:hypothetical protein
VGSHGPLAGWRGYPGLAPGATLRCMGEKFTYEGGPRDKERSEGEVSDFPEIHPGGEYQWSGLAHGQPLGDEPAGVSDDGERATVVWFPKTTG